MTRRARTPLAAVIGGLLRGTLSARTVLDRHFGADVFRARVLRALEHGSLVSGAIDTTRARSIESRAARRMLACLLMHVEAFDGYTAHGAAIWQGSIARRLALSTRSRPATADTPAGPLGGIREVQRYVACMESARVIDASQPDAERVPDTMRARARRSIVRGEVQLRRWSYNVVRFVARLPLALVELLRPRAAVDHAARARDAARAHRELRASLAVADTPADHARAVLAFLRDRPMPLSAL
jgi:hypothetical protein